MADNSYAQLIDDFEKGLLVIKGESLTDYIKRMGGVDYDAKANGGLMYLKKGGKVVDIMPKSMSWKGKAKDYPGIHEVIKQNRKKKTGPGVQKKANGGIMGYAIGGNIINQDINKYQNTDNQMAKVFNQQDLIDAGAAKDGILGFSLNDKGDALEKFRNNATKMREGPRYTGGGVQSQFNQLLKNEQKNETINKEFIQEQINKGFLQNPSDFKKQGNLNDLDARLTNEEYLSRNNNLTANANNIATDFTYDTKTSNFNDSYNYNDVDAMTADEQAQLPFDRIAPQRNIFEKATDFIPFVGNKSLSGMALRGAGNMIKGIGNFFQGDPRQQARNADNKQFGVGDIYGYGMGSASGANKDAFGYNTVSRFGDYEQHMIDTVEKLENLLTKTGRKSFKPGTPNFNKLKDYSKNIAGINEKARIADLEEKERFDQRLAEQLRKANTGYTNRGTRIDYGDYYNADGSTNTSSASNPSNSVGPTSNFGMAARAAKGGLIGYQDGGLVTMFKQKR